MTSSLPSSPPPPDAPNRRIHYIGLTILVIVLIAGLAVIL